MLISWETEIDLSTGMGQIQIHISKRVGHEGYGVPAERFAEDLRALIG